MKLKCRIKNSEGMEGTVAVESPNLVVLIRWLSGSEIYVRKLNFLTSLP